VFIDSGSMYRGVTLKVLENKIDPNDDAKVAEIAKHIKIELKPHPTQTWIIVDGKGMFILFGVCVLMFFFFFKKKNHQTFQKTFGQRLSPRALVRLQRIRLSVPSW
jgi:hypothetical protein